MSPDEKMMNKKLIQEMRMTFSKLSSQQSDQTKTFYNIKPAPF